MRRTLTALAATAIIACAATACGGGGSAANDHSVAQVASALRAVGLGQLHPVAQARFRKGKQIPGVDPANIEGGFDYVRVALTHSDGTISGMTFTIVAVVVAGDRSIVRSLEAGLARSAAGTTDVVRHFTADNVAIVSMTDNPDAAADRVLARLPRLTAYLRRH